MHQREIELWKVADSAVHELRGLAARSAREVAFLHEGDLVAARGGVHRDRDSGDSSANNQNVDGLAVGSAERGERFRALTKRKELHSVARSRRPFYPIGAAG